MTVGEKIETMIEGAKSEISHWGPLEDGISWEFAVVCDPVIAGRSYFRVRLIGAPEPMATQCVIEDNLGSLPRAAAMCVVPLFVYLGDKYPECILDINKREQLVLHAKVQRELAKEMLAG